MHLLSALVVAAGFSWQSGYEERVVEARALAHQGRVEEALAAAEALVESAPERIEGYFVLGDLYRRLWRPHEAVDVFSRAIEIADGAGEAELHREIAVTHAELRAWDTALEQLEQSLALAPDHAPSLFTQAMVLAQSGARSEALRLYERLSRAEPNNAALHFRVGEIRESVQQMEEAEASYRRALELDPDLHGARFRLGKLLYASGRTREAERELARAVKLSPEHAESHLELANALDALGRVAKARHHFESAVTLDPTLAPAHRAYGNFSVRRGERERGRSLLARFQELTALEQQISDLVGAVDFAPGEFDAEEALVTFLLEHERYPLALRMAQRFLLTSPSDERRFLLVASVYDAWGRCDEELRTLEYAATVLPQSAAIRDALGKEGVQ